MKLVRILLFLTIPFLSDAQTVKGYIYDSESTVKGAKLLNTTQNILIYSDGKGTFQIEAKLNDTIVISSYFHSKKTHIITQNDFNEEIVIELKKVTNELDEVFVNKTLEKEVDTKGISGSIGNQLANDIKKNPHLYTRSNAMSGNIDFVSIGKKIGKLFKKRKKRDNRIDKIMHATAYDLNLHLNQSSFFGVDFLTSELSIPKEYCFLFLEFCTAKNIDLKLLSNDQTIPLLELFSAQSKIFLKELETYKKD